MKRMFILIVVLGFTASLNATLLRVTNNTREQDLWGAIYYVFSGSAQRAGTPQQISGQATLALPEEEKPNAARYLIISHSQSQLESIITDPFGTVGVRLIPVGASQSHDAATSVTIEQNQLPVDKV